MDPSAPLLRPLTLGELLDRTYRVYRDRFAVFAGIGMLATVPSAIAGAFSQAWIGDPFAAMEQDPIAGLAKVYGGFVPTLVLTLVFWSLAVVSATAAADAALHGRQPALGAVLAEARPRWAAAVGATLLVSVCTVVALVACCLPVFPVAILLALTVPLVWLERLGPVGAVRRSVGLVWGGPADTPAELPWVRVLVVGLVSTVVVYVLSAISNLPMWIVLFVLGLRGESIVLGELPLGILLPLQVLSGVLQGLFVMAGVIPWTLVYYDLRARREGADLELRARRLAEEAPGT